jgi:hypothetical protein
MKLIKKTRLYSNNNITKSLGLVKAQSIVEYAVLLCVIIATLLVMQFYVKRAYQGRIKQEADSVGRQYSPKHTAGLIVSQSTTATETCTGGNCRGANVPDGMTVSWSNSTSSSERKEAVDSFATEE